MAPADEAPSEDGPTPAQPEHASDGAPEAGSTRRPRERKPSASSEPRERARRPKSRSGDDAGSDLRRPSLRTAIIIGICWLLVGIGLVATIDSRGGWFDGDELEALLPSEERSPTDEPWAILRHDDTGERSGRATTLLEAGRRVDEAVEARVPFAPPRGDVDAWLDAHALYLLPVDTHAALAQRLSDDQISAAIQGMRARLTSPLFGVSGEDPRRDPLQLRALIDLERGSLGHVETSSGERVDDAARVTATGDLLSADGTMLLVQLRSDASAQALHDQLSEAVGELPVRIDIIGPRARVEAAETVLDESGFELALAGLAAIALVLAVGLRRIRPVVAVLACSATVGIGLAWSLGGLGMLSLPLALLMAAFACDAALRLQPISTRGWASTLVFTAALTPLLLSPYPLWGTWSWIWAAGYASVAILIRLLMPALLRLMGGPTPWQRKGFLLKPMPLVSLVLCIGLGAGGAWATQRIPLRGPSQIDVGDSALATIEHRAHEQLFDPSMVVEYRSYGQSPAEALDAAARDAQSAARWLPTDASRVDTPGSFILGKEELAERQASLSKIGLRQRMQEVHDGLEAQGLRADAFAEFLRGSSNVESVPSAQAALDGPLGPWIDGYLVAPEEDESEADDHPGTDTVDESELARRGGEGAWAIRTRVQLKVAAEGTELPPIYDADGWRIVPHGPAIADRVDTETFIDRLGVYFVCSLWLGAFLVWLGTRRLSTAMASAFAAFCAVSGVLLAMIPLRLELGAHLLPALLLVSASATVAAGRCCRAVTLGKPLVASGILLAGLCQVCVGLCLFASPQPLWRESGVVIALGCALAAGLGLFVAPGMEALLRKAVRADRERHPEATPKEEA